MITAAASLFLVLGLQDVSPTVKFSVDPVKKDDATGTLTVTLPEGWHAYQNPPKSEFENPLTLLSKTKGFVFKKISYPAGKPMTSFGTDTLVYEGEVKIPFTAKIAKAIKPKDGVYTFLLDVSYQVCNESTCKPPSSIRTKVSFKVGK